MKKLYKGQLRFLPKKIDALFRTYDVARGSFPYQSPELGKVLQDDKLENIQAECDRLNTQIIGTAVAKEQPVKTVQPDRELGDLPPLKARVKKTAKAAPPAEEDAPVELFKEAEWVDESDIEDYGDLTDKTDGYVDWKTT